MTKLPDPADETIAQAIERITKRDAEQLREISRLWARCAIDQWNYGDGQGGSALQVLLDECAKQGLDAGHGKQFRGVPATEAMLALRASH